MIARTAAARRGPGGATGYAAAMPDAAATVPVDPARTLDALVADGVVLCLRFTRAEPLLEQARAAIAGGLTVLEITLTTPGALGAIETLAGEAADAGSGVLVGAGTALDARAARDVAAAGGRFCLSPVHDPAMLAACADLGLLGVPGAATPTEILAAHRAGAPLVKVFPARALGGPDFLRAVRGPLPRVAMLPTSGPGSADAAEWFAAGASAIGVGAEVVGEDRALDETTAAAQRVRDAVDRARRDAGPR